MPTYEYQCTSCHERVEAVQKFTDPSLTTCPLCGGELRKVFSAVGIVFKGSGFYKNDSRGSSASSAKSESTASSSDSTSSSDGAASVSYTHLWSRKPTLWRPFPRVAVGLPEAPSGVFGLVRGESPGPTVVVAGTAIFNRRTVRRDPVPLVGVPSVGGKLLGEAAHRPVAVHLGEHRRGGDTRAARVTAHHRRMGQIGVGECRGTESFILETQWRVEEMCIRDRDRCVASDLPLAMLAIDGYTTWPR